MNDTLWSDPSEHDEERGVRDNVLRSTSYCFGPDRVEEFCAKNKLDLIIRAHQYIMDGCAAAPAAAAAAAAARLRITP